MAVLISAARPAVSASRNRVAGASRAAIFALMIGASGAAPGAAHQSNAASAAPAAPGQMRPMTMRGASMDGLRVVVPPPLQGSEWTRGGYFLPGVVEGSPPDRADAAALDSFFAALRRQDLAGVGRWASADLAVDFGPLFTRGPRPPQWRPLNPGDFEPLFSGCRPETYYLLPEGQVRVSWLCGDRIGYLSFVDLADHRISKVFTGPAEVPPIRIAPPARTPQ